MPLGKLPFKVHHEVTGFSKHAPESHDLPVDQLQRAFPPWPMSFHDPPFPLSQPIQCSYTKKISKYLPPFIVIHCSSRLSHLGSQPWIYLCEISGLYVRCFLIAKPMSKAPMSETMCNSAQADTSRWNLRTCQHCRISETGIERSEDWQMHIARNVNSTLTTIIIIIIYVEDVHECRMPLSTSFMAQSWL